MRKKLHRLTWCALLIGAPAWTSTAQTVVGSAHTSGRLTWENVSGQSTYRVEWSTSPTGPWRRTLQYMGLVESGADGTASAAVPLHYRVLRVATPPLSSMLFVEQGPFEMGDRSGTLFSLPAHVVGVSSFHIERYEISGSVWEKVRNWAVNNGYTDLPVGQSYSSEGPIMRVSWHDAVKWCNARSEMEGLQPVYYTWILLLDTYVYRTGIEDLQNDWVLWGEDGYRLPTEAEWEKAARGGLTGHFFPWASYGGAYGSHVDASKANYSGSGGPYATQTPIGYYNGGQQPVGVDMGNGFGLYDMAGNVAEHVWDRHDSSHFYYTSGPTNDPRGIGTGTFRVCKGGDWSTSSQYMLCANHDYWNPTNRFATIGFRVVRTATD